MSDYSRIDFLCYNYWANPVKVIGESEKAVWLEVTRGRPYKAWFPKSGFTLRDNGTTAQVKRWLVGRMNKSQEFVAGMRE